MPSPANLIVGDTESSNRLKITINKFRLRSGASAAVAGTMAGVDLLGMEVEVRVEGESEPWRFGVSDKTAKGGFRMPAPSQRLNSMVQKIAKDVISKIKRRGFLKKHNVAPGDVKRGAIRRPVSVSTLGLTISALQ